MKRKSLLSAFVAVLALVPVLVRADDWFAVDLSFYPPIEIPIPWFDYSTDTPCWGENAVYGVSAGVPYARHPAVCGIDAGVVEMCDRTMAGIVCGAFIRAQTAYGLQGGCVSWFDEHAYGLQIGLLNYSKTLDGVQIGIVNRASDACGVQIGIWNVIDSGSIRALPILNFQF